MRKLKLIIVLAVAVLASCSDDNTTGVSDPFVVGFQETSAKILEVAETTDVALVYSNTATEDGTLTVQINAENAVYGRDFVTIPEAEGSIITVDIAEGETVNSFQVVELNDSFTDLMVISFTITNIDIDGGIVQGNTYFELSDSVYLGGEFYPTVGGANEPNQVYIDLSSNKETVVSRDAWDLGFYSGDEFRVVINGSLFMATGPLETTDINSVTAASVADLQPVIAVGTFNPENVNYIDAPNGDILETAIDEISEVDAENPVYLVNLGSEIGTETPNVGAAAVSGAARGWKKIRILRSGNDYVLQYADLDATSYEEVVIEKEEDYNFTFFSLTSNATVSVEPQKNQWDLSFNVFTNIIQGAGSYGYSDYVVHNRKGGVTAYGLAGETITYDAFEFTDIDDTLLEETQNVIGSNWRDVFTGTVVANVFYVLKDDSGNFYKVRFLDLVNEEGERGNPRFEYELLQ